MVAASANIWTFGSIVKWNVSTRLCVNIRKIGNLDGPFRILEGTDLMRMRDKPL